MKAFLLVSATAVASTDAFSPLVTTRRSSFITALQPRRSSYISQATPSSTSVGMVAGGAAAYEQEMYDGVYSDMDLLYHFCKSHASIISVSKTFEINVSFRSLPPLAHLVGVRIGPPPDLPSLLLHNRIVYIGMPLVPAVTELIIAELLYLNYEDTTKPITMYINSSGTTTADGRSVGFETEAFAIADVMKYVRPPVCTVAVGQAFGAAAMLLVRCLIIYQYIYIYMYIIFMGASLPGFYYLVPHNRLKVNVENVSLSQMQLYC